MKYWFSFLCLTFYLTIAEEAGWFSLQDYFGKTGLLILVGMIGISGLSVVFVRLFPTIGE